MNKMICTIGLTLMLLSASARAGVQEFTDKDKWIAAVGDFTTIGFTEFPNGTFVTDQYADLGILFTDGNDIIVCCGKETFPEDGAGLDGNGDIAVAFDTPQLWIGVDFPGAMQIELYSDGRLIFTSFDYVPGGVGNFFGLLSNKAFDGAVLIDPLGEAEIDDLHLGPPAPGKCPWDLDGNNDVGVGDLLILLDAWGVCDDPANCPADFDNTNVVGIVDLLTLLANWGPCP